ncbi:MAG: glycerol-3-phosphate 1-O-acyltransferase PlsY [Nitrospirae bacterium]|nr:glycerol-3-phosphate 1-O-acyltransferase PlsY [Nitrospirota bacterium]
MTPPPLSIYPALYLLIPAAFLIGSVPFGLLVTRKKGIDLRTTGSKNIGATNVLRTAGKWPALLTLLGDALKGAAPVLICNYIIAGKIPDNPVLLQNAQDFWGGLVGVSAVAGHIFSIFLSFKGGKGVATGFGVLAAYSPASAAVTLLIWVATAFITKYSSLAAVAAVSALPVTFALLDFSKAKIVFGILLAVLIVFRHKENIKRILEGTESKIGKKK